MNAISLRNVSRNFGGIRAVADISFDVSDGERLTIIGTNGAGKSTLFNLIAGYYKVSSGKIDIFGTEVSNLPARKRNDLGVARTFQTSKLFPGLTVRENLFIALYKSKDFKHKKWFGIPSKDEEFKRLTDEALAKSDLLDRADSKVADLSYGQGRQLEVAMALITKPKILMLDEPAAGLSPKERARLVEFLKELDKEVTLLLIEHDMSVALAVADRVIVMHDGTIFTQGTADEIRASQEVRELYLGTKHG